MAVSTGNALKSWCRAVLCVTLAALLPGTQCQAAANAMGRGPRAGTGIPATKVTAPAVVRLYSPALLLGRSASLLAAPAPSKITGQCIRSEMPALPQAFLGDPVLQAKRANAAPEAFASAGGDGEGIEVQDSPSLRREEQAAADLQGKFDGAAGTEELDAAPVTLTAAPAQRASALQSPQRRGRAGALSDAQYAELLNWGRQQQDTMGALLTPPIGTIPPDVKAAKAFIEDMIENLAGPRLREKGISLVVNIYGSDTANAFAREFKPGELLSPESDWNNRRSNQGRPWPIRKFYGLSEDQPFRELGITTGLLNRFTTRGQLSFVIAHELTHLLEGHAASQEYKRMAAVKRWWSMQQFEVAADAGAIRLMKGKYDLHAAVATLTDLARLAPESDMAQAAASSHHQPGLRIALAQMAVEREMTTSGQAHQPDQALPSFIKLGRMAARQSRDPNFTRDIAALEVIADAILANPQAAWIEDEDYPAIRRVLSGYSFRTRGPETLHRFLMAAAQRYLAAPPSPQNETIAFFKLLSFMATYYGDYQLDEGLQLLTPDEKIRIRYLLARGARRLGRQPADAVFQSVDPHSYARFGDVLSLPTLQRLLGPLFANSKKWRGFLRLIPRLRARDYKGSISLSHLSRLIWELGKEEDQPPEYKAAMLGHTADYLAELGRMPPREINGYFSKESLESSLLFYEILKQAERHRGMNDSASWESLAQAMAPLMQAYLRYRDQTLAELIAHPDFAAKDAYSIVKLLANPAMRDPRHPLEIETLRTLHAALASRIAPWGVRNGWFESELENPLIILGEMLDIPELSFSDKQRILRAMASFQPLTPDDISREKQERVAGFVARFLAQSGGTDYALRLLQQGEIGLLPLLGRDEQQSRRLAQGLPDAERRAVIDKMLGRLKDKYPPLIQLDGGKFLMDMLVASQSEAVDLDWWADNLDRLLEVSPLAIQGRQDTELVLRRFLKARLKRLAQHELSQKMKHAQILKILSAEEAAGWLFSTLPEPSKASRSELADAARTLFSDYKLPAEFPAIERQLKILLAKRWRLQPGEAKRFFAESDPSLTERTSSAAGYVRGMSALIEEIHHEEPPEQLAALRYLLGESRSLPAFFLNSGNRTIDRGGLIVILRKVREWASPDNPIGRVLVADSILAGPQGLLARAQGERILLKHVLGSVEPAHREFAQELALGVLRSHGKSGSLAAAYVLSQAGRHKTQGAKGENSLLKSLLVAHGAPGIKLGQFLAFTNPELREALGDIQDNAQDFNELELLEAIEARFKEDWPNHYQVVRVLGAGSVNAAVELLDMRSGSTLVMSMAYPDAEVRTAENFRRVERIIAELTQTEAGERRYGYLRHLLPLIKDSVSLEFDKPNAFAMQALAQRLYDRTVAGWKIQSVPASALSHLSIFMGKAPGITARKLLEQDPQTYRRVMRILSDIEYGLLMKSAESAPAAAGLFANPDFHDGQVLVDVVNKTITILDFGQAVPLSDADRRIGMRLLRATAKFDSPKAVRNWAQNTLGASLSAAEMGEVLASSDRMERFVKLVAKIRACGGQVPIAAVHWGMAVNRQVELSKKIGTHLDWDVAARLLASKLGLIE